VVVDERAATVHPVGLVVRPCGFASATSGMDDPGALADGILPEAGPPSIPAPATPAREPVGVRLLVAQPRLEGLVEALAANRERRATELVAYLALHRPDAVSSDRLRTRVFGSAESDAAAKTLFNIAAAARRALGTDGAGTPLLPTAGRSGYRISDDVRVDVEEADDLVRAGVAALEGGRVDEAIALLRAALALVEAEPLSAVVAGYGWFQAEGHEGRLAARLVEAACLLARLAGAAGHRELAAWGLRQARRVEPYSEALSRAALRLAAAAGDTDELRREWRECQRRADELDPGSTPSAGTERLYAELVEETAVPSA
jgi:DNA-binding SARP family transcriptional activator